MKHLEKELGPFASSKLNAKTLLFQTGFPGAEEPGKSRGRARFESSTLPLTWFLDCKKAGANMIYVAIFDEEGEATAIFKCTNEPPVGEDLSFLTMEGLPSGHYLWLTSQGARLLRGEIRATPGLPNRNP